MTQKPWALACLVVAAFLPELGFAQTPPTAVCQNITVYLDGAGNATITPADLDGGSFDPDGPLQYGASQTSFTCADVGANSVNLTVTDTDFNTDNCSSMVTVADTTSPFLAIPGSDILTLGTPLPDYDQGSSDNCGISSIVQSPVVGAILPVGFTSVSVTVFDVSGNSASGNVGVTVEAPLPVELSGFEAIAELRTIHLSWTTESETENAGFAIEHAVDDDFVELGFVTGHGTTDEPQEYLFSVDNLGPGLHRFRLKQIDFDGAFEYSAVVEAAVASPHSFFVEPAYPNPFNPSTVLRFAVQTDQQVEAALYNISGQKIRTLYEGIATGNQLLALTIDGAGLPSGVYLVRLQSDRGASAVQSVLLAK